MFNIGDHVRTLWTESRTEEANKVYANRTGVITEKEILLDWQTATKWHWINRSMIMVIWQTGFTFMIITTEKLEWRKSHETKQEICVSHG